MNLATENLVVLPDPVTRHPSPATGKKGSVKVGNVTIKFYPARQKGGYIIPWYDVLGVRRLAMRSTRAKAEKFAAEKAEELQKAETAGAQLNEAESAQYRLTIDRLNAIKISQGEALDIAERIVAAAALAKKTRHQLLSEIEASAAQQTNLINKTTPEIVEELIQSMKAQKAGSRWIEDFEWQGRKFSNDFPGPFAAVRGEDIKTWLVRLKVAGRTWNNYRTVIATIAKFAKEAKYLPADWDELAIIKPTKIKKPDQEDIYSADEMRRLLFAAEKHYPKHVPALAIMGFAGCRNSEIRDKDAALDWSDVDLANARIRIRHSVAKSNTGRRTIDLPANLVEWLEPYAKARGPVFELKHLADALARIAKKAKVPWKRNALRNTYISVWVAITDNPIKVSRQAGNSPQDIDSSYREDMTKEEAQRWLEIYPTKADVLPLFAHAKLLGNC